MIEIKKLEEYGFPLPVIEKVRPIASLLIQNKIKEGEKAIAKLTIEVCDQLERDILLPKEADDYFLLLDLYCTDNSFEGFSNEIGDLVFETHLFHDYGTQFGPDLKYIKSLARAILNS